MHKNLSFLSGDIFEAWWVFDQKTKQWTCNALQACMIRKSKSSNVTPEFGDQQFFLLDESQHFLHKAFNHEIEVVIGVVLKENRRQWHKRGHVNNLRKPYLRRKANQKVSNISPQHDSGPTGRPINPLIPYASRQFCCHKIVGEQMSPSQYAPFILCWF